MPKSKPVGTAQVVALKLPRSTTKPKKKPRKKRKTTRKAVYKTSKFVSGGGFAAPVFTVNMNMKF